jgi:hypothetical protein
MLSQLTVQIDLAKFATSKVKSLSLNCQFLAILGVLNRAANTVPFIRLVREASILDCSGPKVFAQLCYQPELSGKLLAALEDAKIQTVHYGNMGPVPDQAEIADLQPVLAAVAPSIQVLAIKGRSARFVISQSDLPALQTVHSLEPNTSLRIRVPDLNGQWRCINPRNQPSETTAPDVKSTPPGYVPDGGVIKLASHAPHGLAPDTQRGDSQVNIVPSPVSKASTEPVISVDVKTTSTTATAASDKQSEEFCWLCPAKWHNTEACKHYHTWITCWDCGEHHHKINCPSNLDFCRKCRKDRVLGEYCQCYYNYLNERRQHKSTQ